MSGLPELTISQGSEDFIDFLPQERASTSVRRRPTARVLSGEGGMKRAAAKEEYVRIYRALRYLLDVPGNDSASIYDG